MCYLGYEHIATKNCSCFSILWINNYYRIRNDNIALYLDEQWNVYVSNLSKKNRKILKFLYNNAHIYFNNFQEINFQEILKKKKLNKKHKLLIKFYKNFVEY